MSLTAVIQLTGSQLSLVRHPADGRVVAFEKPGAAFAFAVSLEIAGALSAGTVGAPDGESFHVLEAGTSAADLGLFAAGLALPTEVAA
jgi:hypothetical protein